MARTKRFEFTHFRTSELFIIGGKEQHQAEAVFAPHYFAYGQAEASIDSMSLGGYPFSRSSIKAISIERERRMLQISQEVINAEAIEAGRREVAQAFTKIYANSGSN
jgi:hypothetical protein